MLIIIIGFVRGICKWEGESTAAFRIERSNLSSFMHHRIKIKDLKPVEFYFTDGYRNQTISISLEGVKESSDICVGQ